MKTSLKIRGVSLLVLGIYLLTNISTALYFTEKQKKDVLKILKNAKGQERTIPMKVFRTFLISVSPLPLWYSFPKNPNWAEGVTPKQPN